MNGEEMVSRSMSPSHDDSRKETETTALPPPPLSDENEIHAQHILRRRPRSLTWKGFNPFHFGHIVSQMLYVYTCIGIHLYAILNVACVYNLTFPRWCTD